eukprot:1148510-Pelagomonas_calceolata.AAC.2
MGLTALLHYGNLVSRVVSTKAAQPQVDVASAVDFEPDMQINYSLPGLLVTMMAFKRNRTFKLLTCSGFPCVLCLPACPKPWLLFQCVSLSPGAVLFVRPRRPAFDSCGFWSVPHVSYLLAPHEPE